MPNIILEALDALVETANKPKNPEDTLLVVSFARIIKWAQTERGLKTEAEALSIYNGLEEALNEGSIKLALMPRNCDQPKPIGWNLARLIVCAGAVDYLHIVDLRHSKQLANLN